MSIREKVAFSITKIIKTKKTNEDYGALYLIDR